MTIAKKLLETYVSVVHADGSVSRKKIAPHHVPKASRRLSARLSWKHMSAGAKRNAIKSRLRAMKRRQMRFGG